MPVCSFVYGAGASANASCQVIAVAGNCSSVFRGTVMRMLLTVMVPPENRSFGLSMVADWMNPITSNGAVTGIEGCAPIDTDIAAAAVAAASAHRSLAAAASRRVAAVIRCIILVIIRSLSSRIRAHRQRHVAAAASAGAPD